MPVRQSRLSPLRRPVVIIVPGTPPPIPPPPTDPPPAPTIQSLTLTPARVLGGEVVALAIGLTGPTPAAGVIVILSSPTSGVPIPDSVLIPAGQTGTTLQLTTTPVAVSIEVAVTGTTGSVSRTARVTLDPLVVVPPPDPEQPALVEVTLGDILITAGEATIGTVTLADAALAGGLLVTLAASPAGAVVLPTEVRVPEDSATVTFPIASPPNTTPGSRSVLLTASDGRTQVMAVLTLLATPVDPPPDPVVPALTALTVTPSTVVGGQASQGRVTLSSAAPAGGVLVTITANSSRISFP